MEGWVFHPVVGLPLRDVLQVAGALLMGHHRPLTPKVAPMVVVLSRVHRVVVGGRHHVVVAVAYPLGLGAASPAGRVVAVVVGVAGLAVDAA